MPERIGESLFFYLSTKRGVSFVNIRRFRGSLISVSLDVWKKIHTRLSGFDNENGTKYFDLENSDQLV